MGSPKTATPTMTATIGVIYATVLAMGLPTIESNLKCQIGASPEVIAPRAITEIIETGINSNFLIPPIMKKGKRMNPPKVTCNTARTSGLAFSGNTNFVVYGYVIP